MSLFPIVPPKGNAPQLATATAATFRRVPRWVEPQIQEWIWLYERQKVTEPFGV